MPMQHNIDIVRRNVWWNVHQPKLQSFTSKIDNQRPVCVPIAISPHDGERRTNRFQVERDRRLADVTQMPDFIRLASKIDNFLRQLVMRVGHDQDAQGIHFRTADGADNADITSVPRKIIRLNPRNPRLVLPRVI
jgi:hypothetical protein